MKRKKSFFEKNIKLKEAVIFTLLLLNVLLIQAQNNVFREDNKLKYKENESYKYITFKVAHISTNEQAQQFLNLLKTKPEIIDAVFNLSTAECMLTSTLELDKKYLLEFAGQNGYKTSDYSEKINLMIQMPAVSQEDREKMQQERDKDNAILDNIPADFPVYYNTGDKEKDDADYKKRKDEWIKNNPELYKAMHHKIKKTETDEEKKDRIERENLNKNK